MRLLKLTSDSAVGVFWRFFRLDGLLGRAAVLEDAHQRLVCLRLCVRVLEGDGLVGELP